MQSPTDPVASPSNRAPREGWQEAFEAAASSDDPLLLEGLPPDEFDLYEWE